MIPFDFAYYKPTSASEAVSLYQELLSQGLNPMYYAGGTEIISFSRLYQLYPKAVIDIKSIPECNILEIQGEKLIIGAAVTLSQIQEWGLFPLLSQSGGRVADHTTRGKITLGGNLCSRLPYRETVLPLLVCGSEVIVTGPAGQRQVSIEEVFNQHMQLQQGEILLQVITPQTDTQMPFATTKKTVNGNVGYPQDRIGYPIVSTAALKKNGQIRVAISGACNFPFLLPSLERAFKNGVLDTTILPAPLLNDMEATADYRAFVLHNTLAEIMHVLGEGNIFE